ncbi:MAG: FmdB family zinc ribbon protein [Propioniciclava sp.]
MPTYQYRCADCGEDLEVFQSFTDDALTVCPSCEGTLRKVFNAVGVVFKGSGFYATDNRTKGSSDAAKASTGTKADSSSGGSAESAASASAPATTDKSPAA